MNEIDLLQLRLDQYQVRIDALDEVIDALKDENSVLRHQITAGAELVVEAAKAATAYMRTHNVSYGDAIRQTGYYSMLDEAQRIYTHEFVLLLLILPASPPNTYT